MPVSSEWIFTRTVLQQCPSDSANEIQLYATEIHYDFNTQYMTNSTLACPVKIEYVTKNNIFGLKMMIKSGLEKNILKFLHAQAIFY